MSMSANIKLTISQAPIVACFHLKVNMNSFMTKTYFVLFFKILSVFNI